MPLVAFGALHASGAIGAESNLMPIHCHIIGGSKLAPVTSDAICSEVERAVAVNAPNVRYSAEIRVISPSRLSTTLMVEGRTLPVQNFAVMDNNLSQATIKHFASSLADVVAKAAKP